MKKKPPSEETGKKQDNPSFSDLMSDVEPLSGGSKRARPRAKKPSSTPRKEDPQPIVFQRFDLGEEQAGLAPGIDKAHLTKLKGGHFPPEDRIDLHGLIADEARVRVRDFLKRAWREKKRCVLIVHGRGHHSEGEAVLRQDLPDWLAQIGVGELVMAFSSAQPKDGGVGASYILLRRNR
jgi:DNA-nicking Smr family endonuclease